jgi:hypothetical protein
LKEETVDLTKWRNLYGRDFGPVVWQITDNDDSISSQSISLLSLITCFSLFFARFLSAFPLSVVTVGYKDELHLKVKRIWNLPTSLLPEDFRKPDFVWTSATKAKGFLFNFVCVLRQENRILEIR